VVTKTDRNKTNDDLTVLWLQTYKRLNSVYFICNQSTVNSSLALFLSIFVTPKYLCYIIISRQIFGSGFFLPSHNLSSYQYKLVMFTKGLSIFTYQESSSNLSRIVLRSH
jgi:hypothetical protein